MAVIRVDQSDMVTEITRSVPKDGATMILTNALEALKNRAEVRDKETTGERSMATCIRVFNALTGCKLTVVQGWLFMLILKIARSQQGKYHADDFVDMVGYASLAGEEAAKESIYGVI